LTILQILANVNLDLDLDFDLDLDVGFDQGDFTPCAFPDDP
jgi:hypothetical protein